MKMDPNEFSNIIYDKDDQTGIVLVTINRPEIKNALSILVLIELHRAAVLFDNDESAMALIITGANAADNNDPTREAFSSGGYFNPAELESLDEETKAAEVQLEELRRRDANHWRKAMLEGDFPEAIIRIFLAIGFADSEMQRKGYELMGTLIKENRRLRDISARDLKKIVRTQARILQTDTDQAIDTLVHLLPNKKARREALSLIKKGVKMTARELDPREQIVLDKITKVINA